MIKFCVPSTCAVFEPRTTATTTTALTKLAHYATFGAHIDHSRRSCWHFYVGIGHGQKNKSLSQPLCCLSEKVSIRLELTFTGVHALKPPVIYISVAGASAVLVPCTTRSATTRSIGFLEPAAPLTRHRISVGDCRGD